MEKITIKVKGKIDGAKFKEADLSADVLYKNQNIVVHKTIYADGVFHNNRFTVTQADCGLAYNRDFKTIEGATTFADYIAAISALRDVQRGMEKFIPLEHRAAMKDEITRIQNAEPDSN